MVQQRQSPRESISQGALPTVLRLQRLVHDGQITHVVDGAAKDRHLRDATVASRGGHRVAQIVEVTLEVVAALTLHHVVLGALESLVLAARHHAAVRRRVGRRR